MDLSGLYFGILPPETDGKGSFVAAIPPQIKDRESLFRAINQQLRFPEYFGWNWDALLDCLRDLSWIAERRVIIMHDDVPDLDAKTLRVYLEVLVECVNDWRAENNAEHELVVVFPSDTRADLEKRL